MQGILDISLQQGWSQVKEPETAEEYSKLSPFEKLTLTLKWANEELVGKIVVIDKLRKFDKKLEIERLHLIDKTTKEVIVFEDKKEVIDFLGIDEQEFKYLKNQSKRLINKPKYQSYYKYMIESKIYILKDNDYILADMTKDNKK